MDGADVGARVTRWELGDVTLVEASCGPARGRRGRREVAATEPDLLIIAFLTRGRMAVSTDAGTVLMDAGQAMIRDGARTATVVSRTAIGTRTLLIPRDRLSTPLPGHGRVLPADCPPVRLLGGYLDTLCRLLPELGMHTRPAAAEAALALAAAALAGAPLAHPLPREALLTAIRRHIDENLGDPALTPGSVARAHAVSLRTLHGLFEGGESVGATIRRRRLERCYADLAAPGAESVITVALRWGFRDPSHFGRLFRAQFGMTPRELRAAAAS